MACMLPSPAGSGNGAPGITSRELSASDVNEETLMPQDVLILLTQDHQAAEAMLERFDHQFKIFGSSVQRTLPSELFARQFVEQRRSLLSNGSL